MRPSSVPSGANTWMPPGPVANRLPVLVDPHAVGQAGVLVADHAVTSKKTLPSPIVPSALTGNAIQIGLHRIRVGDVEDLLVGREGDAVGPRHLLGQERDACRPSPSSGRRRRSRARARVVVLALGQAVGRIGEVEVAVRLDDDVVGAVEALALRSCRPGCACRRPVEARATRRSPCSAAGSAGPAGRASGRCCRARCAVLADAGVAGWLHERAGRLARRPT